MKYLLTSLLLTFFFTQPFAPTLHIQGTIIDAITGDPVASALVTVKNEKTKTVSGKDGSFTIVSSGQSPVLTVSAVGYITREISIDNTNNPITVSLQQEQTSLEEVAVTGYGTNRKMSRAEHSLERALQGAVPGVNVTTSRGRHSANNHHQDHNTEDYDAITENTFLETGTNPLSTFSIDVDGASYSNIRRFIQSNQLPPAGSVRVEELINYFHYDYEQPKNEHPFAIHTETGACPWNSQHRLVLIGLQGKKIATEQLPASNLVFLIDVSGSMMDENKLPLVKASMKMLAEQLREQDKVSIVVYAGSAGLVLPPTSGSNKRAIISAIESLEAGGSTAGGAGIQLAYKVAAENMVTEGNNRVILCTDGDFNIGASSDASLEQLIEEKRESGVFLTVLGYGMGNYKDNKMQKLANKGNGNHAYIDNASEAKKVLVNEFGGTLFTIAKDVKLQVEFNPAHVQAYRLIGYENRMLKSEDFNNDKKDAGELGSGHTVTALYEIIPAGVKSTWIKDVDPLKYQRKTEKMVSDLTGELLTVKFRYKKPDGNKSFLINHTVENSLRDQHSDNYTFAVAVAEFGMVVGNSAFRQGATLKNAYSNAAGAIGKDREGYRKQFLSLIKKTSGLMDDDFVGQK